MADIQTIKELTEQEIPLIAEYWLGSSDLHLESMGVDLSKIPAREDFETMLNHQLSLPNEDRNAYAIIWQLNDQPIGHCNTNPTDYGNEANMHLHIWTEENRRKQLGFLFLKKTIPLFFERLKLKLLVCEPYALNPAPNKTMEKLGFTFEKEYVTIPGSINYEQPVNRWVIDSETAKKLF